LTTRKFRRYLGALLDRETAGRQGAAFAARDGLSPGRRSPLKPNQEQSWPIP
jgi:hypothetical protein